MKVYSAFFALLFLSGVKAQNITVCSEQGNTTCLGNNTICLNDGTTESCGNCIAGFIDLDEIFNSTEGCQDIEELSLEEYFDRVQPIYKNTSDELQALRLEQLKLTLTFISEHEAKIPPGAYSLEVNEFSAHLPEDHKNHAGTKAKTDDLGFDRFQPNRRLQTSNLPPAIDWEQLGATTSVKNQENCGCCWSISCMGAVEGATFITDDEFIESLSFQQLISCDTTNDGCDGGDIAYAMQYSVSNSFGGLANLEEYPYEDANGVTTTQCQTQGKNVSVVVYQPNYVVAYSDTDSFDQRVSIFKSAVYLQPVSITMNANCPTFQNYGGGVMTDDGSCTCADTNCIDHGILIVGYNDTNNPPYWKIKNSWGTGWGEDGYFLVSQDGGGNWGLFGILGEGVIPLRADNTSAEVPSSAPVVVRSRIEHVVWALVSLVLGSLFA